MSKKITVTEERWCCQYNDLVPYQGKDFKCIPEVKNSCIQFCKHCGQLFMKRSYMDAAGSRDWEMAPILITGYQH